MCRFVTTFFILSLSLTPLHARIDLEYSDSTLCTNAAVALVQHKGNILEAAKDLTKKESLKALGISMVTAGLTEGVMRGMGMETAASSLRQAQEVIRLGQQAGQAAASSAQVAAKAARAAQELEKTAKAVSFMQKISDRLMRRGIESVVGVGVSAAAGAKPDLGQAAIQLVARAGGDSLAGMAGDGLEAGTLSKFEHGAAHFGTAAVVAAVTNPEDPLRAAMVAGASAVVAHKAAEMMAPEKPTGPVTDEQRAAYNEGVEGAATAAKLITPTLALLTGQGAPGVATSISASSTAVDFNFGPHHLLSDQEQSTLDEKTKKVAKKVGGAVIIGSEQVVEFLEKHGEVIFSAIAAASFVSHQDESGAYGRMNALNRMRMALVRPSVVKAPTVPTRALRKEGAGSASASRPRVEKSPTSAKQGEQTRQQLLPQEGRVGTYRGLEKYSIKGDNLDGHHIPHAQYMSSRGVARKDGVSMTVEQTRRPTGRHQRIHHTFKKQDINLKPRDALAQSIRRVREVYREDGLSKEIRPSLEKVIQENKNRFPELFDK